MSEGKMEHVMDRWIGVLSSLMQMLYWTLVMKRELSLMAKLLIHRLIYVPGLT